MSICPYFWGAKKGGVSPSGLPAIPAEAGYGPEEVFNDLLGPAVYTLTFSALTKNVTIRNLDDTNDMEYQLDSSGPWLLLGPYGRISEPISISTLQLRIVTVGTTPEFEVVVVLTEP